VSPLTKTNSEDLGGCNSPGKPTAQSWSTIDFWALFLHPWGIAVCCSLQTLSLANNQLTGTLPNSLYDLAKLITFDVHKKRIKRYVENDQRSLPSGSSGAKTTVSLEESVNHVQAIADAACKINPDTIVLCHGAEFILKNTKGVYGFYGASSLERLPVEQAIKGTFEQYKSICLE
ncbi:Aldolase-type TIM barrel, partial [Cynara cardunculus var. scolymus]